MRITAQVVTIVTLLASLAGAGEHRAFRVPVAAPLPAVGDTMTLRNPVDVLIAARLEAVGQRLGSEAPRDVLLRRLAMTLTGLPPTPAEQARFLADRSPGAYERMVDLYLASPHYAERWARHWLDAAGYADSNGHFSADSDRPLAWRYRDWVIRAVGQDQPVDEFIRWQLAGDEIAGYVHGGDVTPEMVDPLIATQFLRNAPDGTGESDGNPLERMMDRYAVVEGTLHVIGKSLLGLTLQCARCHDHKYEPVTQREYYALQATLLPAFNLDREAWRVPYQRVIEEGTEAQRIADRQRNNEIDKAIGELRLGLRETADEFRRLAVERAIAAVADRQLRAKLVAAWRLERFDRSFEQMQLLQPYARNLKLSERELEQRFDGFVTAKQRMNERIVELESQRPSPPLKIAALFESPGEPPPHRVLMGGSYLHPDEVVEPGVPASLCLGENGYRIDDGGSRVTSGRRLALARWITSPDHPLTARVFVNRVWQHHFGTGLVATPDNLGASGAAASHPELLDWLAARFVEHGWSLKWLHRTIVGSATFRQSGDFDAAAYSRDPENRLLWRFPRRRLDADQLRDGLLAVAGTLDRRRFGPYVPTRRTEDGQVVVDDDTEGALRRSIYLRQRRTQVLTLLEAFDAPPLDGACTRRTVSNIPQQPLAMLNSPFVRARAVEFANRVLQHTGDPKARIDSAYRAALGRLPCRAERQASIEFLEVQRREYAAHSDADRRAWTDLCQTLFASSAFLYVE